MTEHESDSWQPFERDRLAVFAAHGFVGVSRRITDHVGRETYAIVRGDGATPTVLVHGGLGDAIEWALLAPLLEGPLLIADRPGYGLTYRIDYRKLDFRAEARAWLLDIIDGLGVEQANLVGASMGGFFAMAFATAHPERVRRLVLVGAPAGLFRETPLFLRLWGNPVIGRLISRMKISDAETLRARAFAGLARHPERIPRDVLEVALASTALPGTALTSRTMLNAATTLRGLRHNLLMREDMARLAVPTRFVWGRQDQLAEPAIGEGVARQMSDGQLAVIEDAGHMPQFDQPQAVAAVVNPFLRVTNLR